MDATPAVVLSHRIWQNRYGRDGSIIGKAIRIDEVSRVVIGVMPPGMQFPEDTDLWTPLTVSDAITGNTRRDMVLFGRLAPNVKLAGARTEIDGIARRLASQSPDRYEGLIADVRPFLD